MRPKDEKGRPMKPAARRLDPVPYHEAALFAMDADPRSPALSMKRKLQIIDRAMNTVVDGDAPPKWIWNKPTGKLATDTGNSMTFMPDMWRLALAACERVKRTQHG